MKISTSTLLVTAATGALAHQQQVLQAPRQQTPINLEKPVEAFNDAIKGFTAEAKAIWDEVASMFPDAMDKMKPLFSAPKPHSRRPDSEWDYVIKGADIQSVWVENANGEKEREIDGKLEQYNLRAKKVDPKELGVDNVTQYSGYLDDEEDDKHLFYCELKIVLYLGLKTI
jgi:cathepsin A (carboxypeptidase C)